RECSTTELRQRLAVAPGRKPRRGRATHCHRPPARASAERAPRRWTAGRPGVAAGAIGATGRAMAGKEDTSRDARAERLAAALRANLKRRKAQARARREDGVASDTAGDGQTPDAPAAPRG